MNFPTNGRVIVIDDKLEEEALPLIKALAKKGVAVLFFSGHEHALPEEPIKGIRLIFLDIILEGMDFQSDTDDIVKSLKVILDRIIHPDNGPYIIFGWTKTPRHLDELINKLDTKPVLYLDMEKNECITDDTCDLAKIEEKLNERIAEMGYFPMLFQWESLVNDSAIDTVNQNCENVSDNATLESILNNVAKANLGEHSKTSSDKRKIKAALQIFNMLLSDSIDINLNHFKPTPPYPLTETSELSTASSSKLNSKLLLRQTTDKEPYPGNVYLEFDTMRTELVKDFIRKRFDKKKILKEAKASAGRRQGQEFSRLPESSKKKLITAEIRRYNMDIFIRGNKKVFTEITTVCDHAQATYKYHRIIPGFLLKKKFANMLNKGQNDIGIYVSMPMFLQQFNDTFLLILDFRGLVTLEDGTLSDKQPLFCLRQELLFDVQYKAGTHFSRPGIIQIA
jgi:hypothetical protein